MNLLLRADASVAIGTGHVMRCLALAQAVTDSGGRAVFVMAVSTPGIRAMLEGASCQVVMVTATAGTAEDAQQTIAIAQEQQAGWIVVDGYPFNAEYQRALKSAGCKVLFLDDYAHATHYAADLVLNQNSYASEKMYAGREPYTRLLLGPRHALLRREFISWRGWTREIAPAARKILVTMGGSDPENTTGVVMAALRAVPGIEVTVVVGGSNPHFEELAQLASKLGSGFRLQKDVSNMPALMAWADLAISGAGTTCWEMCLLQLPMLLIDLAENQKPIAGSLAESGAAIHLGSSANVTKEEIAKQVTSLLVSQADRVKLSERCGKLVDGRGTERVLEELTHG